MLLYRVRLRKFFDDIIMFGTKRDLFERNKEKRQGKIRTGFLFYPESIFLKIWYYMLLLLLIFLLFFVPFDIAFIDEEDTSAVVLWII